MTRGAALGTVALLLGCGGATPAPAGPRAVIGNTATADGSPAGDGLDVCAAIARGVEGAPDEFRGFIADPAAAALAGEAGPWDVPSDLRVAGAEVTVNVGSSPDLTLLFRDGGVPAYEARRDEFLACPTFADGWDLERTERDDEHDLTFRGADPEGRPMSVWMRVMSSGDLMVCMHHR